MRYLLNLAKYYVRVLDAIFSTRIVSLKLMENNIRITKTYWWGSGTQEHVQEEIQPYFEAVQHLGFRPDTIIDCGAAIGLFTITAAKLFPNSNVIAFEPSLRQRILLKKNLRLNNVDCVQILPYAVWNRKAILNFKTHGDMSGIRGAAEALKGLMFQEKVQGMKIDDLLDNGTIKLGELTILKMDIEGAELEALEGALHAISNNKMVCIIQAYHLRNGIRTFEGLLEKFNQLHYNTKSSNKTNGLLVAVPPLST